MLNHPDPQVQGLLNDIAEQRDVAMLAKVNAEIALQSVRAEVIALKAENEALRAAAAQRPALQVIEGGEAA